MPEPEKAWPGEVHLPLPFAKELAGMVDRDYLASRNLASKQSRAIFRGCHPTVVEFCRLLVRRMANLGVPMYANEAMRSARRQTELFALGVTKARAGHSAHEFGLAVDIVHGQRGWNLTARQWALVGHVGKELAVQRGLKVDWGGDPAFGFYDPAHWQVTGWKALKGGYPWLI